jgi:SAM-dependent methyltransferase
MSLVRDAKEVIRYSIYQLGLSRIHLRVRRARGQNVDHLLQQTLPERFSAIYKNRVWLNDRPSGVLSGLGSELGNTDNVRRELKPLLKRLETRTLLDLGCGDFSWMKEVDLDCKYIGIDVVPEIISENQRRFASPRVVFQMLDATIDDLPEADTVLCREVLFHLSFADIWNALANMKRSQIAFIIATNDDDLGYNANILSGDFRLLNLRKAPFFFPSAFMSIQDDAVRAGRKLSVWRTADLTDPRLPGNAHT